MDGYDLNDIKQGALGDCYLLPALSVLATRQDLLDRILVTQEPSEHGMYAVRFWKHGAWKHVIVDDRFPIEPDMHADEGGRNCRGPYDPRALGAKQYALPAFAHNHNTREPWVMLVEKAYAKYHGSYSIVEGGHVHQALVDMTGGSAEFYNLTCVLAWCVSLWCVCLWCVLMCGCGCGLCVRHLTHPATTTTGLLTCSKTWSQASCGNAWCDTTRSSISWVLAAHLAWTPKCPAPVSSRATPTPCCGVWR